MQPECCFNTILHTHACKRTVTIVNFSPLITSMLNCCCDPTVVISATFPLTLTNCISSGSQVPQSVWPAARLQNRGGRFVSFQPASVLLPQHQWAGLTAHHNETTALMMSHVISTSKAIIKQFKLPLQVFFFCIAGCKLIINKHAVQPKIKRRLTKNNQVQEFKWQNSLWCFN